MELIATAIAWFANDPQNAMLCIASICFALTHIVAWTPWHWDDGVMARVMAILNIIAGNYGAAKNAVDLARKLDKAITSSDYTDIAGA